MSSSSSHALTLSSFATEQAVNRLALQTRVAASTRSRIFFINNVLRFQQKYSYFQAYSSWTRSGPKLFPQEFRRCNAGLLLEEAGEVVRVLKTQKVCGFVDIMTVHQEVLALLYHKGMDIADGRSAGGLVDDVAQVTG